MTSGMSVETRYIKWPFKYKLKFKRLDKFS